MAPTTMFDAFDDIDDAFMTGLLLTGMPLVLNLETAMLP